MNAEPAKLLDDLVAFFERFVAFPNRHQPRAIALWVLASWTHRAWKVFAYLALGSAVRGSGKTLTLDLMKFVTKDPYLMVHPSAAVLYRLITARKPTLLLDEIDCVFGPKASGDKEDIRAILNAGYRQGAMVPRCAMPGNGFDEFDAFCPKALGYIGNLPDTIADRSIQIRLKRRAPGEAIERYREDHVELLSIPLQERVRAIAEAIEEDDLLAGADPAVPSVLPDRAADNWRPLLAIADLADGLWPEWAREAAVALVGIREDEETIGVRILRDVKKVMLASEEVLPSGEAASRLNALPEAEWGEFRQGKGVTAHYVTKKLAQFDIESCHDSTGAKRGYHRAALEDAWARYLPPALDPEPSRPRPSDQPLGVDPLAFH